MGAILVVIIVGLLSFTIFVPEEFPVRAEDATHATELCATFDGLSTVSRDHSIVSGTHLTAVCKNGTTIKKRIKT